MNKFHKIIIGSTAIKHHFPDFKRESKDLDYAVGDVYTQEVSDLKIEYLKNPVLLEHFKGNIPEYCPPNELYTLKMSHLFWNINWEKHNFDQIFLQNKGCILIEDLFYKLYDYWNIYHGQNKRSDLKMTSEKFFDNALKCEYSHDYLHTLIKDPPTYTKVLKDGAEVEVCEEKFNKLSFEEKCDLVREEIYIMATERMFHKDYRINYSIMLKKFIISHAPLWEAKFILNNYVYLHKAPFDYITLINNKLQLQEV